MVFQGPDEAALLDRLQRQPDDVVALDALGMLAARSGRLDAALVALARAAELAPHDAQIQIHLAHVFHDRGEWEAARLQYARALYLAPDDELAHEGASYAAARLHDFETAEKHRAFAFRNRVLTYSTVEMQAPTVLLIVSAHGGNIDTRPYLVHEPINVIKLVAEELHRISNLPEFDYVFNGIGDGDHHRDTRLSLSTLEAYLAGCPKPVLNRPEHVLATRRHFAARSLAAIPGVRTARTILFERASDSGETAEFIARGFTFPFLVRAPGYHTGECFERVDSLAELTAALESLPGEDVFAMEYVDTRDTDGMFRKYRMMIVDGNLYPAHLAIGTHWKVHYRTAHTMRDEAGRAEENAYLANPRAVLGTAAYRALEAIAASLRLDYAGIDFALDRNGRVVCFEANATMVVPVPATSALTAQRRAAAQAIHHAVKRLLRV